MTDPRGGDPHPDSLPEDDAETSPDSPPVGQDEGARADVETAAGERGAALDEGAAPQPHDGERDVTIDPRVN